MAWSLYYFGHDWMKKEALYSFQNEIQTISIEGLFLLANKAHPVTYHCYRYFQHWGVYQPQPI